MNSQKYILAFFTLHILAQGEEAEAVRKVSGISCSFKDKTYRPGESWHPYLEPFGFMFCMRCVCAESGHVKCNTIKCPVLRCENPVTSSQQCCPRCADEHRTPAGLRAPIKTCRYNGSVYQAGESFTNHHLFPSRQSNQCVMCTCSNGNIFCGLKTCQPITCSSPASVSDTCCLVCKAEVASDVHSPAVGDGGQQLNRGVRHSVDQCSSEQVRGRSTRVTSALRPSLKGLNLQNLHHRGAAETTVKILLQRKHQRACVYSGKTYSHGDVWHPVLGKVLDCILCTCRDGSQECRRITCPNQYPCKHPVKAEGKCCRICPEFKSENNRSDCFLGPGGHNLLVYRVQPSSSEKSEEKVRTIAIERQGAAEVEVQVWKSVEGVLHLMETRDVQKKDVIEHPEKYLLLTTLPEDIWRKFKEEEDKKEFRKKRSCEDGIKEVVKYLNPEQLDSLCA